MAMLDKRRAASALTLLMTMAAAVVLLAIPCNHTVRAQTARTIRIIVPSTAGGGADTLARLLADQISRAQGQALMVENRPGDRGCFARRARRQHAPDHHAGVRHQCTPAEAEL
jgi:tripartite-type tricarboxylate transporter receptor subunit TctC